MLKFFSRMERTRNFVLLLFAIVMVVSLIVFYSPTRDTLQSNLAVSEETAAQVGKEYVTVGEIVRQKDAYDRMGGNGMDTKGLLDGMIQSRIVRQEAERLGMRATDAEVAAEIRRQFKTEDGKPFDQKRYEQIAIENGGSVKEFEENVRDSISARKVQAYISSGVTVSEDEVLDSFKRSNTKFDLTYVPVSIADLAQTIKPTDEELKAFFEENKGTYYISSPQKKIRYLFLNTSKIGEKIQIPEEEIKAEYDKLPADKKIAGIQGQEIVLRVPKPEFEADVVGKANQIVASLRKDGATVSEEAFAETAKGQSENPNTARNGGRIPGAIRQNANNPTDPYQSLLTMKPGEITEPISYEGRFFILRRGEEIPKTFEDAKREIEVSLRNRRAYAVAADLAQKAAARLKETKDIQAIAGEFAPQANMSTGEMIKETDYVVPGSKIQDIGTSPQFEEGIAPLENVGDIGERVPIPNGFAVPVLVDKKEPRESTFEEVKEQVAETYKIQQAREKIQEIADQVAASAGSAGNLAAVASAKGLKAQPQPNFILGSPIGQGQSATTNAALEDLIWNLKEGEVSQKAIKLGDDYYVVGVNKRGEVDMNEFANQRDQLVEQKLQEKRMNIFTDYLAETRRKYKDEGKIKVYDDVVAKIDQPADFDENLQLPRQAPQEQAPPPQQN